MMHDINGTFHMLNAAGRVTRSRNGFMPITTDDLNERIARAQRRIKALQHAINDMSSLSHGGNPRCRC